MATELIPRTWCDVCIQTDGELRVEATWSGNLSVGPEVKTLDLCGEHEAAIIPNLLRALAFGRTPDRTARPAAAGVMLVCHECGLPYKHRKSLRDHLKAKHNMSASSAAAATAPEPEIKNGRNTLLACPECHREFRGGAGLAAHGRSIHNLAIKITDDLRVDRQSA